MRKLFLSVILVGVVTSPFLVSAVNAVQSADPSIEVRKEEGSRNGVQVEVDQNQQTPGRDKHIAKLSNDDSYVTPICAAESTDNNCIPVHCPNGQRQYIRIQTGPIPDASGKATSQSTTNSTLFCGAPDKSIESLAVHEFYETKVKVPAPIIHPADVTLANFPSVFYTTFKGYEKGTNITIANVRLKFTPSSYRWDFGDGKTLITTDAGRAYDPVLINRVAEIEKYYKNTHRYAQTGKFSPTVTVIINGQYSVNGGSWQDIAGFLEATSPATPITVKEARGELVTRN